MDEFINKDGEKIINELYGISHKLVKFPTPGIAHISLPIGDDNDKWGEISVPSENVTSYTGIGYPDGIINITHSVFFTKETVDVRFKNGIKTYTIDELVKAYYDSKNKYRQCMAEEMHIEVPRDNLEKRRSARQYQYYIVKMPLEDGKTLSLAIPDYNVKENEDYPGFYDVDLGERNRERNVRVILEDGSFEEKRMLSEDIKKIYESLEVQRVVEEGREDER